MTTPIPVDELRAWRDADFPVQPGTNEEKALRFLAANPDYGWPPKEIATRTDISESSITKTVARLHEKSLVDKVSGRYFVKPERLAEIQGFLGDRHNLQEMASEPYLTPVHPVKSDNSERDSEGAERASGDEVDAVVQDVVDEIAEKSEE